MIFKHIETKGINIIIAIVLKNKTVDMYPITQYPSINVLLVGADGTGKTSFVNAMKKNYGENNNLFDQNISASGKHSRTGLLYDTNKRVVVLNVNDVSMQDDHVLSNSKMWSDMGTDDVFSNFDIVFIFMKKIMSERRYPYYYNKQYIEQIQTTISNLKDGRKRSVVLVFNKSDLKQNFLTCFEMNRLESCGYKCFHISCRTGENIDNLILHTINQKLEDVTTFRYIDKMYGFVLYGYEGCGKTSFVNRNILGEFSNEYNPNELTCVNSAILETSEGAFNLLITDVSGKMCRKNMKPVTFHGECVYLIFFDSNTQNDLDLENICKDLNEKTAIYLIKSKVDEPYRVSKRIIDFHKSRNIPIINVSNKSCYNFDRPFYEALSKLTGKNINRAPIHYNDDEDEDFVDNSNNNNNNVNNNVNEQTKTEDEKIFSSKFITVIQNLTDIKKHVPENNKKDVDNLILNVTETFSSALNDFQRNEKREALDA